MMPGHLHLFLGHLGDDLTGEWMLFSPKRGVMQLLLQFELNNNSRKIKNANEQSFALLKSKKKGIGKQYIERL
jgi:hypothetical protein